MAKQKTKVEKYNEILEYIKDNEELTNFINDEISNIKKAYSNRKPTATQKENETLMVYITSEFERLADKGFISQADFYKATTISEIKELTPQKLSPLLNKLVAKDVLIKTKVKNTSQYMLKTEE